MRSLTLSIRYDEILVAIVTLFYLSKNSEAIDEEQISVSLIPSPPSLMRVADS